MGLFCASGMEVVLEYRITYSRPPTLCELCAMNSQNDFFLPKISGVEARIWFFFVILR